VKLWLDDIRPAPEGWTWAKSAADFSRLFNAHASEITDISFDHDIASFDLAGNEITGYHCLCIVEKRFRYDAGFELPRMTVHSANPVGISKMRKVIARLEEVREL